ncbi:MAG: PAS domain-containing protein [Polyangiales bacterium]
MAQVDRSVTEERRAILLEISREILDAPRADGALSLRVFSMIRDTLEADFFFNYEQGDGGLRLTAAEGLPDRTRAAAERLAFGQAFCGLVAERRAPIAADVERIAVDPRASLVREMGVRAYLCHPLLGRGGALLGTFSVGSSRRDAFTTEDADFLQTICHLLGLAWDRQRTEERQQRTHDTFYQLIQDDPFGVYMVDADFRLRVVSAGAQRVFENVRPLLHRDFAEVLRTIWPEPFATEAIGRFRHTLATGERYAAPPTVERRADIGETEAYDWRIDRVTLPDGRHGVVCYFYDLSERQRLEAALRESAHFYRQTLESIPGMVFTNTPDGACDYVSQQWVDFTGVPAAEQLGDGWARLLHPDDRPRALAAWRAAVAGAGSYDLEYRIRRAGGGYEWFKARGRAIRDEGGAVVRWFGTAVNVDDLKRAEARLQARERELQSLADNSPDVLSRFDRELRHLFVNVAIERATGQPREHFLGKTNRELGMPPALCDRWDDALRRVFDRGAAEDLHFDFDGPGGRRYFTARLVPEFGADGEVASALGVTHDVTDALAAAEALREADRRKDEFLALLAHELRNPLAPLRTGLQVIRLSAADEAASARVHAMMERQVDHMVRLVDDLLDISRISRGKLELRREAVRVQDVVEQAVEATRPAVEAGRHALKVSVPPAPLWVNGDVTRLVQVLSNLLHNAAKYTPPGGRIEVDVEPVAEGVALRVTDDGAGIAAEMLPKVFDMFVQADRTLVRSHGGLGIGLSLVRNLVAMHGGTAVAESAGTGRGSRFTVVLPLVEGPGRVSCPGASAATASIPPATPRRVLVVDDNEDAADALATMLRLLGAEAAVAHDGAAALRRALEFKPDLVFLDIGMPDMDGYEVAGRLRGDPTLRHVTLVALTGWGSESDKARSRAAGFDRHLVKPVGLPEVEDVLARARTVVPPD